MTANVAQTPVPVVQPLDWESNHFGVPTAKICGADLADDAMPAVLAQARSAGIQLLVWPASGGRVVSPALLDEFAGMLVDRKATFCRSLALDALSNEYEATPPPGMAVVPYDQANPSPALYELAIASGVYSRFAIDPRIKRERFEAMYRRWIDGSVQRELADVVLVARLDDGSSTGDRLGGMITIASSGDTASIGLVAVAAEVRGRGVGSTLMQAAHQWMLSHNATEARVVTQLTNAPACRLYERAGYRLSSLQHYYHFWLQA